MASSSSLRLPPAAAEYTGPPVFHHCAQVEGFATDVAVFLYPDHTFLTLSQTGKPGTMVRVELDPPVVGDEPVVDVQVLMGRHDDAATELLSRLLATKLLGAALPHKPLLLLLGLAPTFLHSSSTTHEHGHHPEPSSPPEQEEEEDISVVVSRIDKSKALQLVELVASSVTSTEGVRGEASQ